MSQEKSLTHVIIQRATEKPLRYSKREDNDFTFPNRPCGPTKDAQFDGDSNESAPTD